MYFYRISMHHLEQWRKNPQRKPLVLRGARQVGKTTLVQKFAERYDQVLMLNLEKPGDAFYFQEFSDASSIVNALLLEGDMTAVTEAETLLFIDEIQEEPRAISLLRYFKEEIPQLHVIAAGSLLEHHLSEVPSFPVGRVQYHYLYPLSFPEFLMAHGKENLKRALEKVPIDPVTHAVARQWYHRYAMIGGMPEVVQNFLRDPQLAPLSSVYESIWAGYRNDVVKYAKNQSQRQVIQHLMHSAPAFAGQRITFQNFGQSHYRSREVGEGFRALDEAQVVQLLYPCTNVHIPLIPNFKKSPRLQFLDTGLLNYALDIQAQLQEVKDLSDAYRGVLLPQLITQEIIALHQHRKYMPHFWVREKSSAQAEVDLVQPHEDLAIPIEIKSGNIGKLRSLLQFVDATPHPYAVRMYGGSFGVEKHQTPGGKTFFLMNLPYYLSSYLPPYLEYLVQQYRLP